MIRVMGLLSVRPGRAASTTGFIPFRGAMNCEWTFLLSPGRAIRYSPEKAPRSYSWRNTMLHALLFVAATVALAPDTPVDDAKKELDKIQGTWIVTSFEVGGQKGAVGSMKLICVGDKYTQQSGDTVVEKGSHKLDPTKKPKTMDVTITEGEQKGLLQLAIYELDGDTLRMCLNEGGDKERPKEFSTTKAGGGKMLVVLKREKKEEKKDEKKDEKK
jgi:uncharacterized protein (TIGR03067 family)